MPTPKPWNTEKGAAVGWKGAGVGWNGGSVGWKAAAAAWWIVC